MLAVLARSMKVLLSTGVLVGTEMAKEQRMLA